MKLRALRMAHVRLFGSEGVAVEDIGDGLNVLAAPNEAGKSTLFDGLQALLFFKSGSTAKDIRQLQPYAGGWPYIVADVEWDGGRYRIEKRFLGQKIDRVVDLESGKEIAVADDAQAWIDRMIGVAGKERGPAGLLWVRQGDSLNLKEGAEARAKALDSVVEEEVKTLTGGKRARWVVDKCAEELAALVTPTGKPRTGGRYQQAEKELARLDELRQAIEEKMERARSALDERRSKQRRLQDLTDPEEEERLDERLKDAREAKDAAEKYRERVGKAIAERNLARHEKQTAQAKRDAFAQQCEAAREQEQKLAELQKDLPAQREAAAEARAEQDQRRAQEKEAEEARRTARSRLDAARKARDAHDARERHAELADHLADAEAAEREGSEKRAEAQALGVRQADIDELDGLAVAIDKAENALRATSTRLQMRYEPGYAKRVMLGTSVLEDDTEVWIEEAAVLSIDDVGDLAIAPGEADRGIKAQRELRDAREALADKLQALNCQDAVQARQRRDERARLIEGADRAEARVKIRAPKGIAALRAEVAALREKSGTAAEGDPPDVGSAERALETAETAEQKARDRWDVSRRTAETAALTLRELTTGIEAAEEAHERALAGVGLSADKWPARRKQLDADLQERESAADRCQAALEKLRNQPLDLEAAEAKLRRLTEAKENRQRDRQEIKNDLSRLDERIIAAADEGVEETFAELTEERESARVRVARYKAEVTVLERLKRAVEGESAKLTEQYLQPVNQQLQPLLGLVFREARVDFDGDTLEPKQLVRAGIAEKMDALSDGTREQVAILTRLGFARLLAQSGRTPPIIMDDALIFSDDDRIEQMFNALHMQATDLQMLVFSCRQRAFQDLGGTALRLKPWKSDPELTQPPSDNPAT